MPNMDGWSFLHALTADPRWTSIPVIIFSAYAEGEDDRLPAVIGVVRKGGVDPDVLLGLIAEGQRRFNDSGAAT
jgi:CheY-like chemotaxis protein